MIREALLRCAVCALLGFALAAGAWAIGQARGPHAPLEAPGAAVDAGEADAADAGDGVEPSTFVAFASSFDGFQGWERRAVEGAMLPIGVEPGPTFVYVNRRPQSGHRWPVGTIFVKSIERGPRHEWVVHAMVKRGLPYNREGAVGWEFFELAFAEGADAPHVVWRGEGPPSGHGYAAAGRDAGPDPVPLVCNDCHGANWQSDGVLTPAFALDW